MALLPIFAELEDQPCLIVGGGAVACRKARRLLQAGARLTVNAPHIAPALRQLAATHAFELTEREFDPALVARNMLVIAAADETVNAAVAEVARRERVLCNVVDAPEHCSFIMPAVVQRGDVTVAVSTAGAAPVLARRIKAAIEELLPARIGALAVFARRWRIQVKQALGTISARRRLWEDVFDGEIAAHVLAGRDAQANRAMTAKIATQGDDTPRRGQAWIVGAGPGDAGLITLRGKQLLASADVVLYDRLVTPEVLAFARADAELISVGKQRGESAIQQRINRLLVEHVSAGRRVCRLKGGDPFVFGRGGEEIEALEAAALDYEIVPGITAALAGAAYAGMALTHRSDAHGVWIGSGHEAGGAEPVDWSALARSRQTLALYMSVGRLESIAAQLLQHGRAAETPCAIVENATRTDQRVLCSNLARVAADARREGIAAPAILFVGEAAARAGPHAWFAPGRIIDYRTPATLAARLAH